MSKSRIAASGDTTTTIADRYWVGRFQHAQPWIRGNIYFGIRKHMGLTQQAIAARFGISLEAWRYRERMKRLYHPPELLALLEFSGLSDSDFIKLIRDIS